MKIVTKKILPEWFEAIKNGSKSYELRLADFDIEVGDILRLEEWDGEGLERKFTGRFLEKKVNHLRQVDLKSWVAEQPELLDKGFYVIGLQ